MRYIASILMIALVGLTPAFSGDKGKKEKKEEKKEKEKEKKTLYGTWQVKSVLLSGIKLKDTEGAKVIISPGRLVMTGKGKDDVATITVDEKKTTGTMDLVRKKRASRKGSSEEQTENLKGLFKLDEDTLQIAWGIPPLRKGADGGVTYGESVRPTGVEQREGNFLMTLQREGAEKKDKKGK